MHPPLQVVGGLIEKALECSLAQGNVECMLAVLTQTSHAGLNAVIVTILWSRSRRGKASGL